jgi:CRP/FNR family cyclic AMP-dependent transcriptional regulator
LTFRAGAEPAATFFSGMIAAMTNEEVKASLRDNTFLGGLPEEVFNVIYAHGRLVRYAKGEILFHRGDEGSGMMLILTGSVKISNTAIDGREAVLNFLGPGDVNGEITVLDGLERTATATVLEPTEAFTIFRRDLMPALLANPNSMLEIIEGLCGKLRVTSALIEDGLKDMPGRTARGLLRLAEHHGRNTKDGVVINLRLSQRDLGGYMGLSRENTSRQLTALRQRGIIAIEGATVVIRDRAGLEGAADADQE